MNNLKKLDQSVFDGLPPDYKFAAVDADGFAWAYEERPDMISFDGMRRFISRSFDATDWKNSLIEREEEEAGANTKRTILCVNACEGFSNEELESANLFGETLALRQQRDELLNILQRLKAVDFGEHWDNDAEQAAIAARALITKFEVESLK